MSASPGSSVAEVESESIRQGSTEGEEIVLWVRQLNAVLETCIQSLPLPQISHVMLGKSFSPNLSQMFPS